MECSCSCDFDDFVEMHAQTTPIARRDHKCGCCGSVLPKGQRYVRDTYKWDGKFHADKTCVPCNQIRNDFCAPMGGRDFREHIRECLGHECI